MNITPFPLNSELTESQLRAIALLIEGQNAEEIGPQLGVTGQTVRNWKRLPHFAYSYSKALEVKQTIVMNAALEAAPDAFERIIRLSERESIPDKEDVPGLKLLLEANAKVLDYAGIGGGKAPGVQATQINNEINISLPDDKIAEIRTLIEERKRSLAPPLMEDQPEEVPFSEDSTSSS
jgi:hypothetical protein